MQETEIKPRDIKRGLMLEVEAKTEAKPKVETEVEAKILALKSLWPHLWLSPVRCVCACEPRHLQIFQSINQSINQSEKDYSDQSNIWVVIHREIFTLTRDVQNRFFFIFVRFFEKKNLNSVWNEFGSVQLLVSYYLCNSWLVNLQQICSITALLVCWINCGYQTLFRSCFKSSLSAHWMQVKLFFSLLIWIADCTQFLLEKCLNGCQIFGRIGYFETVS